MSNIDIIVNALANAGLARLGTTQGKAPEDIYPELNIMRAEAYNTVYHAGVEAGDIPQWGIEGTYDANRVQAVAHFAEQISDLFAYEIVDRINARDGRDTTPQNPFAEPTEELPAGKQPLEQYGMEKALTQHIHTDELLTETDAVKTAVDAQLGR